MTKATLAVLAAGLGTRFGGLKQTEIIDGRGHILLDYSLHDALLAGFDRVVFIIRKEMKEEFLSLISSRRWYGEIDVDFVFQELCDIPQGFCLPKNRKKPWGTAHALSCLSGLVDSPFAIINADDFYGRGAFLKNAEHLRIGENCMIAYRLKNTLSKNGGVSRGVCSIKDGFLLKIQEKTGISVVNSFILDQEGSALSPETPVSMNFWGFTPDIIAESGRRFASFLKENIFTNPDSCEYYIPSLVSEQIAEGKTKIKVIETNEKWYGITYKNDKSEVALALENMVNDGVYPTYL